MSSPVDELLARLHDLESQLEAEQARMRTAFETRRAALADAFESLQRSQRVGLWRYLRTSRPAVMLTAPLIYSGWVVFALLDLFVTVYQTLCFPAYGMARVRRADYLAFDRAGLPYLNVIERFNCLYCSYGNGVLAYAREVAARTEQYWCPIKHARRLRQAHRHYPNFFEHGDAEAFRQGLERLRRALAEGQPPPQ